MADENLVRLFRAQFVEGAHGWLFRDRSFGPAVPVTAAERQLFLTGFEASEAWRRGVTRWSVFVLLLPLVVIKLARPELVDPHFVAWFLGFAWLLSAFTAVHDHIAISVPARALSARLPVAAIDRRATGLQPSRSFGAMIWLPPFSMLVSLGILSEVHSPFYDLVALFVGLLLIAMAAWGALRPGKRALHPEDSPIGN
ncbi:MAG: hypothetical protein DCF31_17825 [Alphaproteobacteria bacterium]|nr:MAG: hypothetical protein DCF31_17825 [Alphaproteobacteria bacterium]